ncbi:MAG: hypothetical protein ACFFCM_13460 [Promethearchaeota archaeon]
MNNNRGKEIYRTKTKKALFLKSAFCGPFLVTLMIFTILFILIGAYPFNIITIILSVIFFPLFFLWITEFYSPHFIIYENGISIRRLNSDVIWFLRKYIPFEEITNKRIETIKRKTIRRRSGIPYIINNYLIIERRDRKYVRININSLNSRSLQKVQDLIMKYKKG